MKRPVLLVLAVAVVSAALVIAGDAYEPSQQQAPDLPDSLVVKALTHWDAGWYAEIAKNGGMGAEVVVFLDPALAEGFKFVRKQGMQLASKMRYLSAQVDALLADDLWLQLGGHANAMARRLAEGAGKVTGVRLARAPEANAIFAHLPEAKIPALQARHPFYVWKRGTDGTSEVRWMCSWDTTEGEVDAFVQDIGEIVG